MNKWRLCWVVLLLTPWWLSEVKAEAPFYTLALEWSSDSAYTIDAQNSLGSKVGITATPTLQFKGKNRQTVIIVPDLAACNTDTALQLTIQALQPTQAAVLVVSKAHDIIYQQTINRSLDIKLPELDPAACKKNTAGIVGELSIAVVKSASGVTLSIENLIKADVGHSWVEFRALTPSAPVAFATAGTYNSIVGDGVLTGINFFREIQRPADIRKTVAINAEQLARFIALIDGYVAQGISTWTPWHNCTAFAIDAWQSATGETLSATRTYLNAPWEVTAMGLP